jgi:hypothetical protein
MDERARVECVIAMLPMELRFGEAPELRVDEGHQSSERVRIAI